jgi:8-oxo-dGTP diphosphatase
VQQAIDGVRDLVAVIVPGDERERADQCDCQSWLASTPDIYRRVKPATPAKHLVSYAVLIDERDGSVFLVDHRLAGLWLPAGGHVEPGEDPAACARREAAEELGIEADFRIAGPVPFFVTVNRTVDVAGPDASVADRAAHRPHTDVSLWYILAGWRDMPIVLDEREFAGGRWWRAAELESADPGRFDPGLGRFLAKLRARGVPGQVSSGPHACLAG